ncbi:MAG: hypothetical protein KJ941_09085 [Bacteroidetes bacterium]|nr:hypothetical protein [Bacteroidota bacterium]
MKTNFNLDRKKVSSQQIESRQNFSGVIDKLHNLKPPFFKSPWFYGAAGLASITLVVGLVFFFSDNEEKNPKPPLTASSISVGDLQDTPCIKPISETSDLAFSVYAIDPRRGGNIVLSSGTEIRIDKQSLVTENSTPVELRIREFHNKEEAFVAGIPMDQGQSNAFESAGMIEIRANQEGKPIEINRVKPIEISLSLYKDPKEFQFWYLDEASKSWNEHDVIYSKEDLKDNKKEIKKAEITLKQIHQKIEICEDKISTVNTKTTDNSLVPTLGSRKLQIEFDEKDFPELKGYKDIEFEYVAFTEEVSKTLKSQVWNTVSLKKSGDYVAVFSNAKGSQAVKVRPVLKGKSLQDVENQLAAAEELRISELAKLSSEKESLQKRALQLQAKYDGMIADMEQELQGGYMNTSNRSSAFANQTALNQATADFQMTRFGLYNCDKPIPYPPKRPEFIAFSDENENVLRPTAVHVFDLTKDCRYSYERGGTHDLSEIGWNDNPSSIIVFDKEGRMFIANGIDKNNSKSKNIVLKKIDNSGMTVDNLRKMIRESVTVV